jgi:hypothetical protein
VSVAVAVRGGSSSGHDERLASRLHIAALVQQRVGLIGRGGEVLLDRGRDFLDRQLVEP